MTNHEAEFSENSDVSDFLDHESVAVEHTFAVFDDVRRTDTNTDDVGEPPRIRYRCPRCMHALHSDIEHRGRQVRCPACFIDLVVPTKSTTTEKTVELYAVDEKPVDVRDMKHRAMFVTIRCPICRANIGVSPEQAGQKMACPDCHAMIPVPLDVKTLAAAQVTKEVDDILADLEKPAPAIYGLASESAETDEHRKWREERQKHKFAVYCRLCGTMQRASDTQVGKKFRCPDCGTITDIRRPEPNYEPDKHVTQEFEGTNQYDIAVPNLYTDLSPKTALSTAAKYSQSEPEQIPVICSLCATRMYAPENMVGTMKQCPDCGTQTMVIRPSRPTVVNDNETGLGTSLIEAYNVGTPEQPVRPQLSHLYQREHMAAGNEAQRSDRFPTFDKIPMTAGNLLVKTTRSDRFQTSDKVPMAAGNEAQRSDRFQKETENTGHSDGVPSPFPAAIPRLQTYHRPTLPRFPLVTNFFAPFGYGDFNQRLGIYLGIAFLMAVNSVIAVALGPVVGLFFGMIGTFGGLLWFAGVCLFIGSVFENTASGSDVCDGVPEFIPFDGLLRAFWFFVCGLAAATPGVLLCLCFYVPATAMATNGDTSGMSSGLSGNIAAIAGANPWETLAVIGISVVLFFPVIFLSYMETGLPLVARGTFSSIFRLPLVWMGHTVLSGILYGLWFAVFTLCGIGMMTESLLLAGLCFFAMLCGHVLFATLIFRLLGRLAWTIEDYGRADFVNCTDTAD